MRHRLLALLLTLPVPALVVPAGASPVTYQLSGTLNQVSPELSPEFSLGEAFTIFLTYESSASGSAVFPNLFDYQGAIEVLSVQVGDYSATSTDGFVQVTDDAFGGDMLNFAADPSTGLTGAPVGTRDLIAYSLQLQDGAGTLLSDPSLPAQAFPITGSRC